MILKVERRVSGMKITELIEIRTNCLLSSVVMCSCGHLLSKTANIIIFVERFCVKFIFIIIISLCVVKYAVLLDK